MKVLVVAAHPDDEVLGCGGTMAKHAAQGDEVYVVLMSEALTARNVPDNPEYLHNLRRNMQRARDGAHKALGVTSTKQHVFRGNRFDGENLLDIVKTIESDIENIQPEVVYMHHRDDLNIDHRITFQAVLTATRPMQGTSVKRLLSFYVPSSTEWAFNGTFKPNVFEDITSVWNSYWGSLQYYAAEMRQSPHPRSYKGVSALKTLWGETIGCEKAEAFELVWERRL